MAQSKEDCAQLFIIREVFSQYGCAKDDNTIARHCNDVLAFYWFVLVHLGKKGFCNCSCIGMFCLLKFNAWSFLNWTINPNSRQFVSRRVVICLSRVDARKKYVTGTEIWVTSNCFTTRSEFTVIDIHMCTIHEWKSIEKHFTLSGAVFFLERA